MNIRKLTIGLFSVLIARFSYSKPLSPQFNILSDTLSIDFVTNKIVSHPFLGKPTTIKLFFGLYS